MALNKPRAVPLPPDHTIISRSVFSRRDLLIVLIIVVIATLLMLPIFIGGFPHGPDLRVHYRWSIYFYEALQEGFVYPRWLAGMNRGYGSPSMFYYAPLQFYVVAAFKTVVGDWLLAITLSCWLSLALSGVTMYVFTRPLVARWTALLAAVVYIASPHVFFDLYRVNTLSEFWTFVWIPLVLDAIRRIAGGEGWRAAAYLALSYGLLLFTHVPIPFIVTLTLPVYALILTRDKHKLIQMLAGLAVGVGLSAVFLVSVLFETKYVRIARVLEQSYADAFLFENLDVITGIFGSARYPHRAGYVREANLVVMAIALLFVLASVIIWIERKSLESSLLRLCVALGVVTTVSLFMTTRLTKPLWDNIRPLQYLQSPIRWLVIVACATSLLAAIAASTVAAAGKRRRFVYMASLVAVLALNLWASAHISTQRKVSREWLEARLTILDVPEYAPLWWDQVFHEEFDDASVLVDGGEAEVSSIDDQGSKQRYQVHAKTEAKLKFRSVHFPGWVARIDEKRVDLRRSEEGLIQVIVPAGEHYLTLSFELTWRHIKAGIVSAASVLILVAMLYSTRRRNQSP